MTVKHLNVEQLSRIARAGGGLKILAGAYNVEQLAQIARAASGNSATIFIEGSAALTEDGMATIARAGKGCIVFE